MTRKFYSMLSMVVSILLCIVLAGCGTTYVASEWEEVVSDGEIVFDSTVEGSESTNQDTVTGQNKIEVSEKPQNNYGEDDALEKESFFQHTTEAMRKASILNKGDDTRLAAKIKAALANKSQNTTIACFGDSITEGSSASSMTKHYSTLFKNWWSENISTSVTLVNKGVGGTLSYFGVHWVDDAVLKHKPDIIFIEYVNDRDGDSDSLDAMDSLVRKCLSLENNPAVILLEMSYNLNGKLSNGQVTHMKVAKPYGVPVISWRDAIKEPCLSGELQWKDLSPDIVHPNDKGHALLCELMVNYVNEVIPKAQSVGTVSAFNAKAVTDDRYKNAKIVDRASVTAIEHGAFTGVAKGGPFENGWETTSGGSITFKLSFKTLGILYHTTNDGKNGEIKIEIDGKAIRFGDKDTLNGNWNESYDNVTAKRIMTNTAYGEHTVKVTVVDGALDDFKILGWLIA